MVRGRMYPFERFTARAKKVLTLAQEEAERSHHSYIGTEHLLLGLLRQEEGMAAKVLNNLGVELTTVRSTIESVLGRNEQFIIQQIIPTSRVKVVIETSFEEARRMGNTYVGTEHLLLGLLLEGEGIAAHVLQDLGANLEKVRGEIDRVLKEPGAARREETGTHFGPSRSRGSRLWPQVADRASRLAAEQHTSVGPEHYLAAVLDADPLVRRVLAALGIDEARVAEALRIATPPDWLLELRRQYEQRAAELGGWRELPPRSPGVLPQVERRVTPRRPSDAEREELSRLRAELEEAERRWRTGEELAGGESESG
jgi:ATP-dependent Clp protease ATP-binding subunit ClpA